MYTVYVQRNKRFNLKHYEHPEAYHTIHTHRHIHNAHSIQQLLYTQHDNGPVTALTTVYNKQVTSDNSRTTGRSVKRSISDATK